MELLNVYDYEAAARAKLPQMVYDYYASGAHDEITLRENHAAYDRIRLSYRVLRDVARRDLGTVVLGQLVSMPILVAPTAFHRMAHPEGEVATARAAGSAGTVMILSTLSNSSIEEVAAAARGPVWFQLYIYRDREATRALVGRAEEAGCTAIVLTVDAPLWGRRERDVRNRFQLPPGLSIRNLPPGMDAFPKDAPGSGLAAYVASQFDLSLTWRDVEWLCGITRLPVLVKGVVSPEDARLAVESGAVGLVVSNHGGRQLDTAPATIEALPGIVEAAEGRLEVLLDGGIRRGTDVVKALAFGARAVAVGRPVLWGLAVDGEVGVRRILGILREELDLALGLCGCSSVDQVGPELIA
ncbi:MAG: alpha-hydroxy acid oxidase [Gemmatimonadota bacterium]